MNKPIIIFTNFWDADKIVNDGFIPYVGKDVIGKINFICEEDNTPINFSVNSIALMQPPKEKLMTLNRCFKSIPTIGIFCPTYDILMKYKNGGSWEEYCASFMNLMRYRKPEIKQWLSNLEPNKVYVLCCWENTSGKSKCHRQLIYDAFCNHKNTSDNNILIYRSGGKANVNAKANVKINLEDHLNKCNSIRLLHSEDNEIVKMVKNSGITRKYMDSIPNIHGSHSNSLTSSANHDTLDGINGNVLFNEY